MRLRMTSARFAGQPLLLPRLCRSPSSLLECLMRVPQPPIRSILNQLVGAKGVLPTNRISLNPADRLKNILYSLQVVSHRGTASSITRPRMRSRSPFSVTTSIFTPRRAFRSCQSPPRSSKLRPCSISTNMSISLFSSAWPLATEPKIRTFLAPCCVAILRISCRFRFNRTSPCKQTPPHLGSSASCLSLRWE